jgi:hypothetical protein
MSPVTIVLIVLGGVFVLGGVACGGLIWLGYTRTQETRDAAEQAERDEARRREIADLERAMQEHEARFPPAFPPGFVVQEVSPPKPGFQEAPEPPPQPKATAFPTEKGAEPNRWRVLFRSKKPELWNTNTQAGDDFAIPLRSTPAETKYLRLRRMDTGEAIIIKMTRERIGWPDPVGPKVRWNGEGKDEHGGYHLGIAEGPVARFTEGQGTIGVLMDGWDANPGSGFGHAHHIENGGQRFSWKGKEIPAIAFEIAVTVGELTDAERAWLRD